MKPQLLILFVLPVLCLIASCKKESSTTTPTGARLKMYIEDASQTSAQTIDTFTVSYDNNGRITGLTSPAGSFVYTYGSNNTAGVDIYGGGMLLIHETGFLNSSNLLDSTFQFDNSSDTTTEKYIYSNNQLTKLTTYDYSTGGSDIYSVEDFTYDGNGDMVKDVESDGSGNVQSITTYTYTSYPLDVSIGPSFVPTKSKHLPATATQTDGSGYPEDVVTYTYEFDSSNRLIQETDAAQSGDVVVKKYIY